MLRRFQSPARSQPIVSFVPGQQLWHAPPCYRAFGAVTLNYLGVAPFFVPRTIQFDQGGFYVQSAVATALLRCCIYRDSNYYPGALLYDSGQKDASSVGGVTWALDQTLTPGLYWLGGVGQTAAPNLVLASSSYLSLPAGIQGVFFPGNAWSGWLTPSVTGACPATYPAGGSPGIAPLFCLRNVVFA